MKSFFSHIANFFKGVFTNPNTIQVAQSTIRMIAPLAAGIVAAADPQDAALARAVIYEVQTDLGALNGVLQHVQNTGDKTLLGRATAMASGINDNLNTLLAGAHVKNPALTATITTIVGEIQAIVQELPDAQPLAKPPVPPTAAVSA